MQVCFQKLSLTAGQTSFVSCCFRISSGVLPGLSKQDSHFDANGHVLTQAKGLPSVLKIIARAKALHVADSVLLVLLCTWLWQMQHACWKAEAPKQGQVQKAKTQEEQQQRLKLRKQCSVGVQSGHIVCCQCNEERMYSYFKGRTTSKKQFRPAKNSCSAQQETAAFLTFPGIRAAACPKAAKLSSHQTR